MTETACVARFSGAEEWSSSPPAPPSTRSATIRAATARRIARRVANLDEALGKVLEAFDRGGMLEKLTIVLTSDHGHHTTPRFLVLDEYLRATLGVPILLSRENDGEAPFLARWERYSPARVVVTTSGEREASVHLRTSASWNDRPSLEEILAFPSISDERAREVLPVRLRPGTSPRNTLAATEASSARK